MTSRIVLLFAVLTATATEVRGQFESPAAVALRVVSIGSVMSGEGPMWAADGRHVLFTSNTGGPSLWRVPVAGGSPERVAGPVSSGLVRLSPSGERLAFLSDESGNPELWILDLATGTRNQVTDFGARINALAWAPDGRTIVFSAIRYGQFDLWRVDPAGGPVTRLTSDPRFETYPTWAPDGRTLYFVRSDDSWANHEVIAIPSGGGAARVVVTDRDLFDYGTIGTRARFGYPLISPDGRWVLFRSHRSGWLTYWVAPTDGGGPAPRQLAPENADQSDAQWSPDGRTVAFVSNRNGTMDLRTVAIEGAAARVIVPLESGVVSAPAWSPDGKTIAFSLASPTRPQDLYLVPASGGQTRRLTESFTPDVEATLIAPEKISYRSDAFTINGYLFKPAGGRTGRKAPGIMYIHGGPTGQFADTYLAQAQFLARMGYLVLAPNIRGSSGYGKPFEDANNPCWTHCDLRDVLAGVGYLKDLFGIDSTAIGITGISYGGIMSMGAIAHAPGVFQAAAPQSGYGDWISFQDYNTEIGHDKLLAYEWGPYPDSAAVYRRNSPIFSADRVTTPAFVLHGEGTAPSWRPGVYPIPSSIEFVHALDRLNKPVKYKVYPGESYYVYGRENSRQVLLDLLEWFDRYLGGGSQGAKP